jgi:ABC-type Zn uptake system ZnuABC Zn-binding protein ZnuA
MKHLNRGAGILAVVIASASCSGPQATSGAKSPGVILTTFQPLYSFTSKVVEGSPCLKVVNLAPRNLGPHEFNLEDPVHGDKCREAARGAVAVVTLRSLPVAPAFDRIYPWCRRENIRIVEIDPSVSWDSSVPKLALLEDPEDTASSAGRINSVEVTNPNPHVWLSLSHAIKLIEGIERDIAALDPDHAALCRRNADSFQKELRTLKADVERKLAAADRLSVVTLTEGFPYLTSDLGIQVVDYILSPKDAAQVTARIKASGARVVLAEEAPDAATVQAIAAAGARVVVLSTLEEGWGEGDRLDSDGYLKGMKDNLRKLVEALLAK